MYLASSLGVLNFYKSQQKALRRAFDIVIWSEIKRFTVAFILFMSPVCKLLKKNHLPCRCLGTCSEKSLWDNHRREMAKASEITTRDWRWPRVVPPQGEFRAALLMYNPTPYPPPSRPSVRCLLPWAWLLSMGHGFVLLSNHLQNEISFQEITKPRQAGKLTHLSWVFIFL